MVDRELATHRPRSILRLGLDFVLFCLVLAALPFLALTRAIARPR